MKRKFEKNLEKWLTSKDNMPLMVVGARQVGKTYIINEFCNKNFKNYIYINLEKMTDVASIFESSIDPDIIIENLELKFNKKINSEDTIIFIDEIQVSERAITSLKYFEESEKNFNIICAGSLLGVKLNRFNSSFPVGKVKIEYMYPMDFEEFLWAIDRNNIADKITKCYNSMEKMEDMIHEMALNLYKIYLYIGGMPKAILNYVNNNQNIIDFDEEIKSSIITSYLSDMSKYLLYKSEALKINAIYNSIPRQLGKENKKFNYKVITTGANGRDYKSSIDWLDSSHMIYKSLLIKKPETPLKANVDENSFKIYLSDVGLLTSLCDMSYEDIVRDEASIFKGALTENYVAQAFQTNGMRLYYWKSESIAEIDFLIKNDDGIIPIEVKAGTNITSKSLNAFMKKYNPKYGIRISAKNFGYSNNIKSVPLYATFLIR